MAFGVEWINREGRGLQANWRPVLQEFETLEEAEAFARAKENSNIEMRVVDWSPQAEAEAEGQRVLTIDITPRGCATPEGSARVNKAMEAFEASHVRVANEVTHFLDEYGKTVRALLRRDGDEPEAMHALAELESVVEERHLAQDAFLRAVAGR